MNGFLRLILAGIFVVTTTSCTSAPSNQAENAGLESSEMSSDEAFEDFGGADDPSAAANDEMSLENELNEADGEAPAESSEIAAEPSLEEEMEAPPTEEVPPPAVAEEPPATPDPAFADEPEPQVAEATPEPEPVPEPEVAEPAASIVNITNIRFKSNDSGGTVIVDADGPIDFTTRKNEENNQMVIEIPNSKLPKKLKRPFNTRDMAGLFGSIDAYQNEGSTTSRIVLQLREGVSEPVVQNEGNSLLLVASNPATSVPVANGSEGSGMSDSEASSDGSESGLAGQQSILSSASLEEFLSGTTQFYGKKISIETSEMDIREVFKFLSEESGVNLVLNDSVKGTVSLKLRQVPWDQALVMIMKTNKLGYTRSGDVLRIAPLADIRTEEEDAAKLAASRKAQTPLKVRVISVSYAKVEEIANQVKPFLSDRGRVVAETRTSAVVISDLDENIERALKLIQSIDVPPAQVLIEGKVVEATDSFQRNIGVNWGLSGKQFALGGGLRGAAGLQISPGFGSGRSMNLTFRLGTIDVLGDLTSSLQLYESTGQVKVLSSPRVVTLHNEAAEINQTTQLPIVTSTKDAAGNVTPTVQFKDIMLKLGVTPQITNDGGVIMQVDVTREFAGAAPDQNQPVPPVNSRKAKTKVLVRNGQTAVIGGIYQNDQNLGDTKVPILGDIPFVGWLFKSRTEKNEKNELMIFITPRILNHSVVGSSDNDIISQ